MWPLSTLNSNWIECISLDRGVKRGGENVACEHESVAFFEYIIICPFTLFFSVLQGGIHHRILDPRLALIVTWL